MKNIITPQERKRSEKYFSGKTPEEQQKEKDWIIEHLDLSLEQGDGNIYVESRSLSNLGDFYFPKRMNSELLDKTAAYRVFISDNTDYELEGFKLDTKNRVCVAKINKKKNLETSLFFK